LQAAILIQTRPAVQPGVYQLLCVHKESPACCPAPGRYSGQAAFRQDGSGRRKVRRAAR
jgi:hypothetical protein